MAERRVLCVFGTRPEAIKMLPVVRALAAHAPRLRPVVCVTDQHQEMLDQVLDFFGVTPAYRLGVMREGQSPSEVAARVLERLPGVLARERPAAVLVQGDTTTTLAAALAAFYDGVPVGHVEAGLRTYRKDAPFPEEANRQLTSRLAEWHFAATPWARDNLLREHVAPEKIAVTGNKLSAKRYYRHSGYPGGLRSRSLAEMLDRRPEEVIRLAVKGMLPRNRLARKQLTKLKVYAGPEHPHAAQQPQPMEISK